MATGDRSTSGLRGDGFGNGELQLARQAAWSEKGTGMAPSSGSPLMFGPLRGKKKPMAANDIVVTLIGDYHGSPESSDAIVRVVSDFSYLPKKMADGRDAMDCVKVVGRMDPSLVAPEPPGSTTSGENVSKEDATLPAVGGIQRGGTASIVNNSRMRVEVGDRLLALPPTVDSPTDPEGSMIAIVTPMGPYTRNLNFTALRNGLARRLSMNAGITDEEVRLGIASAMGGEPVLPFAGSFVNMMADLSFHSLIVGAIALAKAGLIDINTITDNLADGAARRNNADIASDQNVARMMNAIEPHLDSGSVAETRGVPIHDIVLGVFGGLDMADGPFSDRGLSPDNEPLRAMVQGWLPTVVEIHRRYQDTLDRFTIATAMSQLSAVSPGAPPPKVHCLLKTA